MLLQLAIIIIAIAIKLPKLKIAKESQSFLQPSQIFKLKKKCDKQISVFFINIKRHFFQRHQAGAKLELRDTISL